MKPRIWHEPGDRNDRNLDVEEREEEQKEVNNGELRSDLCRSSKS